MSKKVKKARLERMKPGETIIVAGIADNLINIFKHIDSCVYVDEANDKLEVDESSKKMVFRLICEARVLASKLKDKRVKKYLRDLKKTNINDIEKVLAALDEITDIADELRFK